MKKQTRESFIAGGVIYNIGLEPENGARFGLGFGGRRYTITWPDGSIQETRNLWHGGETDKPDTATLQGESFWGGNLRVDGIEHHLQPPPHNLIDKYRRVCNGEVPLCVLDSRPWHSYVSSK